MNAHFRTVNDNLLLALLWLLTGVFAAAVVALFNWADRRRTLADLAARPCPKCGHLYGPEILHTLRRVRYRWLLLRGNTMATLGAPRSTFLVVCSGCYHEAEFKEGGRIFIQPQVGVLSFTRTVEGKGAPCPQRLPQTIAR